MRFRLEIGKNLWQLMSGSEASEIAEFAISLPLLMMLVIGIYDFGTAFSVKDKLNAAVREAARVASNQPSSDLTNTTPNSILAIRQIVDNDLVAGNVNDCGLATAPAVQVAGHLEWTFTTSCGAQNLILSIDRGYTYTVNLPVPYPAGTYTIEATEVQLQYPYTWTWSRVAQFVLTPGSKVLKETVIMQNMN